MFVAAFQLPGYAQDGLYPHNAATCERCHNEPARFGSSTMIVRRVGSWRDGKFVPATEGGIHHRNGESAESSSATQIVGDRIAVTLLGDGFVEAIDGRDIARNAELQRKNAAIEGTLVNAPVLEAGAAGVITQAGRFGWKSQHSSLLSACADSLRNELGMRNRLYPNEYPTHATGDAPTPVDMPDPKTGETELQRLVNEIRQTEPPARDSALAAGRDAQAGEQIFATIGCAACHVSTYKTMPAGTRINSGTYRIPKYIGNTIIHPYSDFLLHDVGTGDSIPQAAKPEFLDPSTANKFRTPPLWGLRFRHRLMHDGNSPGITAAIARHGGQAATIRQHYNRLTAAEKNQVQAFLNSL